MKKTILFHSVVISFSVLVQILLFLLTAPPWIDIIVSSFTASVSATHEIVNIFSSKKRDHQLNFLKLSFSIQREYVSRFDDAIRVNGNRTRIGDPAIPIPTMQSVINKYRNHVEQIARPSIGKKKEKRILSDVDFFISETQRIYTAVSPTDVEMRTYDIQIPKHTKYTYTKKNET